jgi:alcohol dehydrogenase class IV
VSTQFEFATAGRIIFGAGAAADLGRAVAALGRRALVVTGAHPERSQKLAEQIANAGVVCTGCVVAGEPTIELVRREAETAREARCDVVVAIGGGSVIDAGKALAALLTNPGDPLDYLEVIGRAQPLEKAAAPLVAVPTTAGAGSEATRNAVLASAEHRVKASMRSVGMLPRLALIDPALALGLPAAITAATGLDALTQLIEPYVSIRANAMTDLYCTEGMRKAAKALPRAFENGMDLDARSGMAWASLLGGMALANSGLGAVHGFAAVVGGMFPAPHGAVCAALLPHVVEVNVEALHARAPQSPAIARYGEVARLLTGQPHATAADAAWWAEEMCQRLGIPPLRSYGVEEKDVPVIVEKAARASSMKANPIPLTDTELTEILTLAIAG